MKPHNITGTALAGVIFTMLSTTTGWAEGPRPPVAITSPIIRTAPKPPVVRIAVPFQPPAVRVSDPPAVATDGDAGRRQGGIKVSGGRNSPEGCNDIIDIKRKKKKILCPKIRKLHQSY